MRPPPGGRAGAALRSWPWGVGRDRSTGKLIRIRTVVSPPDRKNPYNKITTYSGSPEQAFPRIVCVYRIFWPSTAGPPTVRSKGRPGIQGLKENVTACNRTNR